MKYKIIFILLILSLVNNSFPFDFTKGIYFGVNNTHFKYSDFIEVPGLYHKKYNLYLYRFGFFLEHSTSNKIHLRSSLNYFLIGQRLYCYCPEFKFYEDAKLYLSYISSKMNSKFYFSRNCPVYIFAGPEASYLINAKIKGESTSRKYEEKLEDLNNINISLEIGGGFEFIFINNLNFFLEGYYSYGLIDVPKKGWGANWSTREFGITLGIKF